MAGNRNSEYLDKIRKIKVFYLIGSVIQLPKV